MITFFTIVALFGTIAFFLYALSAYDNTKIDKSEIKREKENSSRTGEDPRKVFNEKWDKNIPRPRICPVCGVYLKKHEFLYASISDPVGNETKKQAHIYGCRYCYLGRTDDSGNYPEPKETLDL